MTAAYQWLIAEDTAVKQRFSGLTVSDDRNAGRPVQVFFRYPEGETEKMYPFITIEHIDIVHARARQHSEITLYSDYQEGQDWVPNRLEYWPSTTPDPTEAPGADTFFEDYLFTNEFIPVDMLYQVTTYCRSFKHDRELTSKILTSVVPFRWGAIGVEYDDTMRWFDMLDWTNADMLDPEAGYRKRIFRKIYTLQMTAEIPSSVLGGVQKVTGVPIITVEEKPPIL